MAPDWRQLLRWLKPGRSTGDGEDKATAGACPSDPKAMPPGGEAPTPDDCPVRPPAAASETPSAPKMPNASRRASRQVISDAIAQPPVNRNGIPVLDPGEDLEGLLLETEESGLGNDQVLADLPRLGVPPRDGKKRAHRTSPAGRRKKPRTNRHGLPLLSDQDDLQDYFSATDTSGPPAHDRPPGRTDRPGDCHRRDKNGIPMLDHCRDLGRLLEASPDEHDPAEDLSEAFERSLAHDTRALIKKKTGGYFPTRQLTLKERLKRYPRPQGQLDLHGLTAIQAEQRTAAYIRTAHANGLFTLRIIVGKGLHSESGAVLPDVVEDRLNRLKRDGLVMAYRWDKGVKRKSGAVIVYLEPLF